ncbi:MAG: Gfo/Idh/MocA family oxidoreductase [Bryobacteraceae bacterium]
MVDRRNFVKMTAASMTAASYSRILGANGMVNLGLIGAGGRGKYVMGIFQDTKKVNVGAICDVYSARIDEAMQKAASKGASSAKGFRNHQELLQTRDLDAVLIATPDHWHMGTAIDALNAGKDVYVEKPLTLKMEEGPAIVKAARVNNRICQVGMQQRSGSHYLQAKEEYIQSGKLGKITLARTWWHGNGAHLQQAPPALRTQPTNLDWARFLGPVKWRDWDPQQFWNFRAYLDFGGGQVTDLFTHWIDVVHMFMDQDNPYSGVAAGGIYHYRDGRTAPDTINVLLEYPGGKYSSEAGWTATFEATLAPGLTGAAVEMVGTEGRLMITRQRFEFTPKGRNATPVVVQSRGSRPSNTCRISWIAWRAGGCRMGMCTSGIARRRRRTLAMWPICRSGG